MKECQILVECCPVGIEFQSALNLDQSLILLPALERYGAEHGVNVGVVRLCRYHGIGLNLRVVDPAAGQQQVSEVDPRLVVCWLQVHSAHEFSICCTQLAQMLIGLRQFEMSIGKALVYLQSILILNRRFPVLALGAVPLSTLQIFLLAHVRISVTAGHESDRDKKCD